MNSSHLRAALLGLLAILYATQIFSPLRTNTDATCFLQMGASASDGLGFVCCKNAQHYPIGYPALLSLLDRAGIACSATIITINLIALTSGLVAAAFLLRRSFNLKSCSIEVITAMTLLNWVIVKHVTLPITDIAFFGSSLVALAILHDTADRPYPQKFLGLAAGAVLVVVSVAIRTIGIALVPAFLFATVPPRVRSWWLDAVRNDRRIQAASFISACVGGLVAFAVISRTNYFRELLENWNGLAALTALRLSDWGQLLLNTSMAKVPACLNGLDRLAGAGLAGLLALGSLQRRRFEVVDIYMAAYLVILFLWPYPDARFWIPVIPLLLGYIAWAVPSFQSIQVPRLIRFGVVPGYLAAYALLGFMAIGYSTWLTFSGDRFGDRFGGGVYRDSYRVAFGNGSPPVDPPAAQIDPQIVRLLERYQLQLAKSPKGRSAIAETH